jgi:hypothetical protein
MENYRLKMHPSYLFNSNVQRVPNYQQQSGQPIYNIGSYAGYPVSISHPTMYHMNHPFQRTFASVVGCENQKFNRSSNHQFHMGNNNTNCNNNGGLLNSFFKRFTNQNKISMQQPPPPPPLQQQQQQQQYHSQQSAFYKKEFEDYSQMPSLIQHPQTHQNYCYTFPSSGALDTKIPIISGSQYPSYSHKNTIHRNNNNSIMKGPNGYTNFYEKPHNQYSQRWYNRSFNGFRCNRNNNNNSSSSNNNNGNKSRMHHNARFHDANNPKNVHEKERQSIERNIRCDFCDISSVAKNNARAKVVNDQTTTTTTSRYETAKSSNNTCDRIANNSNTENPPFEIYSLEEFPAIVSCTQASPAEKKISAPNEQTDIDEGDFVMLRNDAHVTTPSFVPRRFTFCEKVTKLVKSPQKLLLATPRRSCLKPTRRDRSLSECSDDFIVFEYPKCDNDNNVIDNESEDDSDEDESEDDDDSSDMSEDTVMDDESMDLDDTEIEENTILEQSPDSGNEEKKVNKINSF